MKILELFAGTQSFSKVARELGHETFCIDNNPKFNNDMTLDLLKELDREEVEDMLDEFDIIWMSPPCTTFSMAAGNTHWAADHSPKTKAAKEGKLLLKFCEQIANYCIRTHKIFIIENPRARARWFLPEDCRQTAWYCQYGDSRAKPTDIWTNLKGWKAKACKNNNPDCNHERAPRGSKTGTQGLKGNMERSIVPRQLCLEILKGAQSNTKEKKA